MISQTKSCRIRSESNPQNWRTKGTHFWELQKEQNSKAGTDLDKILFRIWYLCWKLINHVGFRSRKFQLTSQMIVGWFLNESAHMAPRSAQSYDRKREYREGALRTLHNAAATIDSVEIGKSSAAGSCHTFKPLIRSCPQLMILTRPKIFPRRPQASQC